MKRTLLFKCIKSRNKHPRRRRNYRSSCSQIFIKISSLKNFAIFIGKQQSHFKKFAGLEARKSVKRRLQHRCFSVKIAKVLRTAFSIEQLWWLLLELRHFFSLWYITLKFMKIVWHKHNLMISLLVGSGHTGKYLYEIPHEYLKGEGTSWGNRNFPSDFPSRISCNFFTTILFW